MGALGLWGEDWEPGGGALGGQNQEGWEERGHPKFHGFLWLC